MEQVVIQHPGRTLGASRSKRAASPKNSAELSLKVHLLRELTEALHSTIESLEIPSQADSLNHGIDFYEEIKRYEISLIESALRTAHGSQMQAAKLLNLKPTTLNAKIKLYDIHWKCCSKSYVGATSRKVSGGKS